MFETRRERAAKSKAIQTAKQSNHRDMHFFELSTSIRRRSSN